MSPPHIWSVSPHLLWTIWLAWTTSLRFCTGASWSALVKQTQITAWWAQTRETNADGCRSFCTRCPPSPPTHTSISSRQVSLHFNLTLHRFSPKHSEQSIVFCPVFSRMTKAVWWCVAESCRVCCGSIMAAITRLTPQFTPSCANTIDGSGASWTATQWPLHSLHRQHEATDRKEKKTL